MRRDFIAYIVSFFQLTASSNRVISSRFFWSGKIGGPKETALHIEFTVEQ